MQRIRDGLARRSVFISYRRSDAGGYAGQLLAALEDHYGARALFLDHQSIVAGQRWELALADALDAADVVVVVIGSDWSTVTDADGERRLDDPNDWVRREIEAGLRDPDATVIPVIVGNATLPTADDLPESLRPMLERQVLEIRPEHFKSDVGRLIRTIGGWRSHWRGVPFWAWTALAIAVALIAAIGIALAQRDENRPPTLPDRLSATVTAGERVRIDLLAEATDDRSDVRLSDVDPLSSNDGRIEHVGGGEVAYEPAAGFHGPDSFMYRVADEDGGVSEGSVSVNVLIGPMRGDFNVAVAEFARLDANGAVVDDDSRLFAERVFDDVETELIALNESGNFNFEVRSPTNTGPITGVSRAERSSAARDLAKQIDADVIVYGTLTDDGVEPEFFIQARKQNLADAEELAGDFELGSRILGSPLDAGTITNNASTQRALSARARALTQFVIGLSWYSGQDYGEALAAFEAADEPDWLDGDGKEILHLFLGNAAGKLGDVDRADDEYDRALDLNDGFARALLGRAEAEFFRAAIVGRQGECTPGDVDPDGLQRSEQIYLDARTAADRPAISNIDAKVSFGLGRLYNCMTRAGVADRAELAAVELKAVIDEHEAGNESIRFIAAESYANLAVLASPEPDNDDVAALCGAVGLFDRAIDTTDDDERAGVFDAARSQALARLDELGTSCP